jgi:hypothetical protein
MKKHAEVTPLKTLTLINNGSLVFPASSEDYEELCRLKLPFNSIDFNYWPTALVALKKQKAKFVLHPLKSVELKMWKTRVLPKWKHKVSLGESRFVLSCDKEHVAKLEALVTSLTRWYKRHYVTLTINVRRTSKSVTYTVEKQNAKG